MTAVGILSMIYAQRLLCLLSELSIHMHTSSWRAPGLLLVCLHHECEAQHMRATITHSKQHNIKHRTQTQGGRSQNNTWKQWEKKRKGTKWKIKGPVCGGQAKETAGYTILCNYMATSYFILSLCAVFSPCCALFGMLVLLSYTLAIPLPCPSMNHPP